MKEIIETTNAPAAIGPYVQATKVGNFVYTSGQISLDPATGKVVEDGIEAQTRQVLKNLEAVLHAAGADFSHVVKTTVFLTDLADFAAFNAIYAEALGGNQVARSCVQVAALPMGVSVEIEAVAILS